MPKTKAEWQADIDGLRVRATVALTAYRSSLQFLKAATNNVLQVAEAHRLEHSGLDTTRASLPFLRRGASRAEGEHRKTLELQGHDSPAVARAKAERVRSREHVGREEHELARAKGAIAAINRKLATARAKRRTLEAEAIARKRVVLAAIQSIDAWVQTIAHGAGRDSPPAFINRHGTPHSRFKQASEIAIGIGERHEHFFRAAREYLLATRAEVCDQILSMEKCIRDWCSGSRETPVTRPEELLKRLSMKIPDQAGIHKPFNTLLNTMQKVGQGRGRLYSQPLDGSAPGMPFPANSPSSVQRSR